MRLEGVRRDSMGKVAGALAPPRAIHVCAVGSLSRRHAYQHSVAIVGLRSTLAVSESASESLPGWRSALAGR